ncbi:MFS transporter [Nocardia abscessus]|uniref:MFS transporter n=1 Tax=Nocardia abscessus TaxID=120957 RepID=UPI002453DCA6|nr:MFS transporter [Nocardia abscessus]
MTTQTASKSGDELSRTAIFALCWLVLLADGYDLYVYGATIPGFVNTPPWNATTTSAGLVGSIALVGMLCGSLLAGICTNRFGPRRLVIGSVAVFATAMLACSLAPNFAIFGVFRFIACVGLGCLLPTAVALTNEFAPMESKSIVLGVVLTGPVIGTVVAAAAAMWLVPEFGVRPVYAVGGLALLLLPILARFIPESPAFLHVSGRSAEARSLALTYGLELEAGAVPASESESRSGIGILLSGAYLRATLGMWLMCMSSLLVMFGLSTWLPQVMKNAGMETSIAISFLLFYSLGGLVGTVAASLISQRTAPKYMVFVGFLSAAFALAFATTDVGLPALIAAIIVAGFGGMGTQNMINDHVAQFYPSRIRAAGLGWLLAIGRLGAIAAPTYGALLIGPDGEIQAAALAFGIPAAIGAIVAMVLPRHSTDQVAAA